MNRHNKLYTAIEAAEILMNEDVWSDDDDEINMVILPPEKVDHLTDEEDVNENTENSDLMPKEIAGSIEIHCSNEKADTEEITEEEPDSQQQPGEDAKETLVINLLKAIESEKIAKFQWADTIPSRNKLLEPVQTFSADILKRRNDVIELFEGSEPHQVFEYFVNNEIKEMIIEETNRYASQNNDFLFELTMTNLNTFNAILMLTGYHSLPRTRMFWEKEDDVGVPIVYEALNRSEFELIKRYLHFADNTKLDVTDKFTKVRKLYDITNKNIQQFGFLHSHYSIDEQMVPYTGKNSSKQTIRTKSIRFGYKNFVMCSDDGYPYFLDPYCGKKYGGGKESKNLSARSVLDCVVEVDDWSDKEVYFDNWFSSLSLLSLLKKRGIRATGTVRADRLGKDLKLNKKDIKGEERGAIQTHYEKSGIACVSWNDNAPVIVISNVYGSLPLSTVNRWASEERAYKNIYRPNIIMQYNTHMGGVDSLDSLVSNYRIDIRGKKWYWPHYINTIDVLKSAAFKLFKIANPESNIDFLHFIRRIATHYLRIAKMEREMPARNIYRRKKSWKQGCVAENERTAGQHFVEKTSQKRCRVCPARPRTWCPTCEVGLCMEPCFKIFHTNNKH